MMNHTLHIESLGISLSVEHGTALFEVLKSCNIAFPCGGQGICGNCKVRIIAGRVVKDLNHESLCRKKGLQADWCLACYTRVEDDLVIEVPDSTMAIQTDRSTIDVSPGEEGVGVAIDLGSTTIVAQLVDLKSGKFLSERSGLNPQGIFGADIISRITYAMAAEQNLMRLRDLIRDYLRELIESFHYTSIKKVKIVGNTVMHHLFAGYDIACLGRAPFNSPNNRSFSLTSAELDWLLPQQCSVEFLPNISHFVGSDILAGILACGLCESEEYSLLVDLGTNGEIALGNKNRIWCTSTAAGPAFEGINISCGMRATTGAICSVDYKDGKFQLSTIGDSEPRGICGSGLVEAIHCFLENGLLDSSGIFVAENTNGVRLADEVMITAFDIREFQLAKAAIATGIQILMEQSSILPEDIKHVYLTGGLGNYIDSEKVCRLGLLPAIQSDRCIKIGNAALAGCKRMLNETCSKDVEKILRKVTYCPLESDSRFMDLYCGNMFFQASDSDNYFNPNDGRL